jgi:hypothetical protein
MSSLVKLAAYLALASAALSLSAACLHAGTPTPGAGDAGGAGSPCVSTSDCSSPEDVCGYPIEAGCAAQGVCVPQDLSCTVDGPVVCDCNGDPVGLACLWGPGYAPLPVPSEKPGCMPDAGLFD